MGTNLSPEQLKQLQALIARGNSGYMPYGTMSENGQTYSPMVSYGQGENNVGNNDVQGYYSYDPNHQAVGDPYQAYGMDGSDAGQRRFEDPTPISDFLVPLGAALAMGTFLPGMTGAGAGAGGVGAAVDPMMYGGTGAGTWGAGGAGAAAAGGGAGAGSGGLTMGSELFPASTIPSSTIPGLASMAPVGAGGGSFLSSLLPGGMSGAGGLLAAGLGALGGSQGVKKSITEDKSPWAPMVPFLMNDQGSGLFNRAQGLLDRSFSPDQMAQNDWMRQHAVGLLMPQQQNNFSRFFPGH